MTNLRFTEQLAVRGGPAVYPQPRYEARVRAGKVEIRAARN